MSSERLSTHLTGLPSASAALAAITCSTYPAALGPNPPPTQGHTIRSCSGSSPSNGAYAPCTECGAWCDNHRVSPPSSCGLATAPLVSIGTPASRWLTIVTSATASAPSHGSPPSLPNSVAKHTFDPASGKSNGASGFNPSAALMIVG